MKKYVNKIKNDLMDLINKANNSFLFSVVLKEQESRFELNDGIMLIIHLIVSFMVEFVIESFSRHSVTAALTFVDRSTQVFLYNSLVIFCWSLIAFLFRKRRLVRIIIFTIWLVLGVSNGIILSNRVTPLTGPDLRNVTEALGVVKKYFNGTQITAAIIFSLFLIFFILIYMFRCPKRKGRINYLLNIAVIVLCVFGLSRYTGYCLEHNILSSYFSNIAFAYQDYGFPYCFTVTITDTGVDKPNNYSEATVHKIIDDSDVKVCPSTLDLNKKPNVIIVQLESFFDPSRVDYFETSEDPIPNWHSLCENKTSGFLTVPTIGAGTVNTEFEVLTGLSIRFFGAGEYPYKEVLLDTVCESSAFVMKDLGYKSFALHNNEANFYSRKKVYKNLGFDNYISGEYMLNQDDVNENGWNRDRNLIDPIIECLKSTEDSDYIFTVSVQPHGSYPTEQVYEGPKIKVSGEGLSDDKCFAWEYYVNQLHEEDQFVADLINAVKKTKEKTIIVFYGDHLPTMKLTDSQLKEGSVYETCYLVWDNMNLKEKDENIYSYQLFAKVLDKIGVHEGNVFKLQQSNFDHSSDDFLHDLQTLQFDILYGNKYLYRYKEYIPNEEYRLGLYDPIIESYEQMASEVIMVNGSNFTQSSKVFVDGEMADTVFLNENQLFVIRAEVGEHSKMRIGVQSNSSTHRILSYGPYYYVDPLDDPINQVFDPEADGFTDHGTLIRDNEVLER